MAMGMALGRIGMALLSPYQTIERPKPFNRNALTVDDGWAYASGTDGARPRAAASGQEDDMSQTAGTVHRASRLRMELAG